MKSEELALQIDKVCDDAIQRILGVGHDQYASGSVELKALGQERKIVVGEERQRFEDESWRDNFDGLEEELLDCITWASMTILKLRELRVRAEANSLTP